MFDASELAELRALEKDALTETATVYTADATTKKYTTIAKANLKVRLMPLAGDANAERAELAPSRTLHVDPSYALPEYCQVLIGGVKWAPVVGTSEVFPASGTPVYRRVQVVQVR